MEGGGANSKVTRNIMLKIFGVTAENTLFSKNSVLLQLHKFAK